MRITAGELALALGGRLEGDDALLEGIAELRSAGPRDLAFLANPRYRRQLGSTRAGAVLLDQRTPAAGRTAIRVPDPYAAFARAIEIFHPPRWPEPGVDPLASVHSAAELGEGVRVDAFAVVQEGARVGPGSWLQPGAFVGRGATLGRRCRLMPGAVLMDGCVLGDRVWLNPGAVVGAEGFGFAPSRDGWLKIQQPGTAVIEDDVELGANTCVDRAAIGCTRVRRGAKLDNLCQVGHGAEIGEDDLMVAYAGVAGSSRLARRVTLAARAGVLGHLEVGEGVTVASYSVVTKDQPAGRRLSGVPARPHARELRLQAARERLPELVRALDRLERRVAELEARLEELP